MQSSYNRKYYLHQALRAKQVTIVSQAKTISLTEAAYTKLSEKSKEKLFELQRRYNYSLQYELV